MSNPTVAILGTGVVAKAVAGILIQGNANLRVWGRNSKSLKLFQKMGSGVEVFEDLQEACRDVLFVFVAIPASGFREVVQGLGEVATGDQMVIHATRGVEPDLTLPHRIIREETCIQKIGCLGGPLYLPELVQGRPVSAVVASRFDELVEALGFIAENNPVYLHGTRDLIGVEVAGAVSHVTAIAVGMAHAMKMGDTVRGVLLTHGLLDAARLGRELGADPTTFAGLAGVGDLIPRRIPSTDRHVAAGEAFAQGASMEAVIDLCEGVLEGVVTAAAVVSNCNLELPLIEAVHGVCVGEIKPSDAVEKVLQGDLNLGAAFGFKRTDGRG